MGGTMGMAIATHNRDRPAAHPHWAEALAPAGALPGHLRALGGRYAQSRGYRNRLIRLTAVAVAAVAVLLAARPVRFVLGLAVTGQPVFHLLP